MRRPDSSSSLADWLAWQESLHGRPIELGLTRVRTVAGRLNLPGAIPTLTVAGTNGKGSSATLLSEIYRASGRRVGLYTSPHLIRYNERIAVDGVPAEDPMLCKAFAEIEQVRGDVSLTYFEFGTLAALWVFRECRVEVQVLEVGLGGRLDAVNLVDADGALITAIGLDHQDWLGPDRESIGFEKAGVLRPARPAIYADAQPVSSVVQHAHRIGARLQQAGVDFSYRRSADAWSWIGRDQRYKKLPLPGLGGPHQLQNAAGVVALVEALQLHLPVSEHAIRSGLPRLFLPGRFERSGRIIMDVAHNAEAVEVLCEQLRMNGLQSLNLILGMLSDKPVEKVAALLSPFVDKAFLTGLPGPRGLDAQALGQRVGRHFERAECFQTVADAYRAAFRSTGKDQSILACGSFLTVSAVKEQIAHG